MLIVNRNVAQARAGIRSYRLYKARMLVEWTEQHDVIIPTLVVTVHVGSLDGRFRYRPAIWRHAPAVAGR